MSNVRRVAGMGAMLGSAAGIAALGLHDLHWIEWSLVASAGVVAAAGLGLLRKSVIAQVASRSVAWMVFAPAAMVAVVSGLVGHHPDGVAVALAASSGGALLLARPMLHTAEANAEFSASRFRSWLLAGSTASTALGLLSGLCGLDLLHRALTYGSSGVLPAIGFLALGASLLGSALGVLRLRTWGILLGGLTSVATLGAAALMQGPEGVALALLAMPGLLFFVLPVLIAKRERAHAERSGFARVADYDDASSTTEAGTTSASARARVRVAIDDSDPFADEFEQEREPQRASLAGSADHAPDHARRAQHV